MENEIVKDEITENIDNKASVEMKNVINKDKKYFNIESFTKLITFLAGIYTYINGLHMTFYSMSCQEFYGVPKEYFYNDSKYAKLVYLLTLIGGGFIFIFPIILKKLEKIKFLTLSKLDSILYSILYSFAVLNIFILFSERFIKSYSCFKIIFGLVTLFSIISGISVYSYIYGSLKTRISIAESIVNKKDKINLLFNKVKYKLHQIRENINIKRFIKYIFNGLFRFIKLICKEFIIISIINIVVFFIFSNNILRDTPENKTIYEIATLKDGSEKVVICHYQDKVILMDFLLLFSNSNELPSLDFSKGNYSVEPVEGIKFKLRKFKGASNKFL